jgi:hypothetical protein
VRLDWHLHWPGVSCTGTNREQIDIAAARKLGDDYSTRRFMRDFLFERCGHKATMHSYSPGRPPAGLCLEHELGKAAGAAGQLMPKTPTDLYLPPADQNPDICEVCGQKIDKRSPASIEHHSTPRHMPYAGKRQSRWRRQHVRN